MLKFCFHLKIHVNLLCLYILNFVECGGKNFHFIHKTADIQSVVNGTVRSAFEYSGQKCSACSRMYIPKSLWSKVKDGMINIQKDIKVGSPLDKETFVSAVIDDKVSDTNTHVDDVT